MWISRVRVTGGFLHGLDVPLSQGLNVVIGPRGAGKTALLEVLRHALGAQHPDQSPAAMQQRSSFLEAVLGAGEVIVDVESNDGGRHLVVDAQGAGQRVDLSGSFLVLGQNELEGIASDAPSRLNLLDLRTGLRVVEDESPDRAAASDLTVQLFDIRAELESRREEASKRDRLMADRALLASQEAVLLGRRGGQLAARREQLRAAEETVIQSGRDQERLADLRAEVEEESATAARQLERLRVIANRAHGLGGDLVLESAIEHAEALVGELGRAISVLRAGADELRERNTLARQSAAPIREELEEAEAGLGQITGQLRNIDAELRSLDENDLRTSDLVELEQALRQRRAVALDHADHADEFAFRERAEVARSATSQVSSNIVVIVEHLADTSAFKSFLLAVLKGTNTRATSIDALAERVLPRQLLELVETRDAQGLAAITGLGLDRARKLITHLEDGVILASLARIRLTDLVDFRLRDGAVDKSVDELSTGQKCSVTLPIVMSEQERSLILDQPEDHLDNAFLVSNVVTALLARTRSGVQTIVATHNANIPVLGSAGTVVVLASDGTTGAVEVQGPFDDFAVVDRITQLMEGGRDAFARRSSFYAEHGGLV
ncbi:MAG: hypothetical protein QOI06_3339 [Nocardioidaceae bacterium]|jgi:energy-coupling factor transporter ATP-binding protein EcfA2|nr:hypothetical protein [Nocardioidaceae bacterium]